MQFRTLVPAAVIEISSAALTGYLPKSTDEVSLLGTKNSIPILPEEDVAT